MSFDTIITTAFAATPMPEIDRLAKKALVQGLLYGIAHIQSLPPERQELSSMCEMCDLVRKFLDTDGVRSVAIILWGIEHHVGFEIDLWPIPGGPGPHGSYSDEEMERHEALRQMIKEWKEQFAQTGLLIDAPPSDVVRFY